MGDAMTRVYRKGALEAEHFPVAEVSEPWCPSASTCSSAVATGSSQQRDLMPRLFSAPSPEEAPCPSVACL